MQRADVVNHLTMILHASLRSNEPPKGRCCPHRVDVVRNDDKSFVRRVLQHDGIGGLFGGIEPIIHVTRDEATQTTVVEMSASMCASCPLLELCPIRRTPDGRFEREFTDKARRTAARRSEAETDVFRERYSVRSGIESTNGGLKNRLGLGKLRVRGRGTVFRTILLKVSGWNVLRASASEKWRAMVQEKIAKLIGAGWVWPFGQPLRVAPSAEIRSLQTQMSPNPLRFTFPREAARFQLIAPLTA